MLLTRFNASKIHGYLDFNIPLSRKLTFLTGINGSGKTSVLNSIVSLITPQLNAICELDYEHIQISFQQDGRKDYISASKSKDIVSITCSATDDVLVIAKYISETEVPSYKELEYENEYYRELYQINSQHPVLSFISGLPTPMFLGLDRRGRLGGDLNVIRPGPRSARMGRNIFGASLARSLWDAAGLAETDYRDRLIAGAKIGEEFRREILLRLLAFEPVEHISMISLPNADDLREIKLTRKAVSSLPDLIGLPRDEVESRILPFLNLLQGFADRLKGVSNVNQIFGANKVDDDLFNASVAWSFNSPQLRKIKIVTDMLENYDRRVRTLSEPSERYLSLINRFLTDSGKEVCFDESGYIYIKSSFDSERRSLNSLSSGEA